MKPDKPPDSNDGVILKTDGKGKQAYPEGV